MQESTYEILLQLPLFQGLGRNELTEIVSKVKMDFRKYEHGKTIIEEDSPCTFLAFLIRGELTVEHTTSNHTLTFSEHMAAPSAIGTENLFGLSQHHTRTYKARSDVQMLFINKNYIIKNMLNQLEAHGLLKLERKQITIPAMQDLVAYANTQNSLG